MKRGPAWTRGGPLSFPSHPRREGSNGCAWSDPAFSLHLLYVNTRLLPEHVRPPMWRRIALVAMALFYGFFSALSIGSVL